ncbi:acetyltransferase [Vibrio cholerae]|nr:acetyltransferase [Vibrio cholerae]
MQLLCLGLSVMRCQPLRRALCSKRDKNKGSYGELFL